MRGGRVLRHRAGVQGRRVDVQASTGLDQIGDDQADNQGQRREHQEIGEGLGRHAADLADVTHAGDADHDGQEDHRGDDHLHQLDEAVAQRLQTFTELREEVTQGTAQQDGTQHLHIQVAPPGTRSCRSFSVIRCDMHTPSAAVAAVAPKGDLASP
jgi:hypothetical protein